MFCPKCGNSLPDGSVSCNQCGANIETIMNGQSLQQPQQQANNNQPQTQNNQNFVTEQNSPQATVNPQQIPRQQPNQFATQTQNNSGFSNEPPAAVTNVPKSKKNIKVIIIAVVAILAIAIGGFAAYKFIGNDKGDSKTKTKTSQVASKKNKDDKDKDVDKDKDKNQDKNKDSSGNGRELGKYTYWANIGASTASTLTSYADMLMYQHMEKITGIEIDFIHPTRGLTGSEAFQILLSSDDKPDMIEYNWSSYNGGADQAIADQVIISINEYMEKHAPNYYELMEGGNHKYYNPQYKAESQTLKGNYYGFRQLNIGSYRGFSGLYIRKDMLDSFGLDVPVTIDDWTNVLKTAKENGVDKPLTGSSDLFSLSGLNAFNGAWHVGKTYHIDDNGKVQLSLEDPAYKEYIAKMAEWYSAGYIDPDYIVQESESIMNNMTNDSSIATFGFVGGGIGKLLSVMEGRDPDYSVVACPYPVLTEGDESWFQQINNESGDPTIAISYDCGDGYEERYKEAIEWCDYFYSEKGEILKIFGVEGETYEEENGKYKYTSAITDPSEYQKVNANSVEAALYHFFRPANAPGFNQHDDYLEGYYAYQEQKDALKTWNMYLDTAKKHQLPTLQYTEDEVVKNAEIVANGCTNDFDATVNDIIMGKQSLEEFDKALQTAKNNGYDELLEIRQTAYDRYLAKLK